MDDVDPQEHHKLIFAHAGAALYHAQVFEEALACLILVSSVSNKKVTSRSAFDILDQTLRSKTLGGLLRETRKHAKITAESEQQIDRALEERNELVHHFFKDQTEAFCSKKGRDCMISKLVSYQSQFSVASEIVERIAKDVLNRLGVSDEALAHKVEAMIRIARGSDEW